MYADAANVEENDFWSLWHCIFFFIAPWLRIQYEREREREKDCYLHCLMGLALCDDEHSITVIRGKDGWGGWSGEDAEVSSLACLCISLCCRRTQKSDFWNTAVLSKLQLKVAVMLWTAFYQLTICSLSVHRMRCYITMVQYQDICRLHRDGDHELSNSLPFWFIPVDPSEPIATKLDKPMIYTTRYNVVYFDCFRHAFY